MGAAQKFPIAITGMHRSGTSMITRALHDSGLHLVGSGAEELIDAAEDNPEGFWENKAIVACNDELLEAAGGSWDNPPDLVPQAGDDPRVAHLVPEGREALGALSGHDRWGFKDPRTCLTAAYWLDLQPDLRFVICVRHPLEVALSLKRRNQNSYSLGLQLWERYYATVLDVVPEDRRIVTHYDTYFVDADAELARLGEFTGLTPAPGRVRSDLRHHSIGVSLVDAGVSDRLRALYATLCREAGAPQEPDVPPDEGRVRRLILDGAVAARHAEQRQAAIERLEQREEQFRAEHRQQIQELERKLAEARGTQARQLEALQRETLERLRTISASAVRTQSTLEAMERRRFAARAKRSVRRALREADVLAQPLARRLPGRAQQRLEQLRRVARRGARQPGPTLKEVGRRVAPKAGATARSTAESVARSTAQQLPSSARARLHVYVVRVRRTRAEPRESARRAVRRLPPPAQDAARRAWRRSARLRRQLAARAAARATAAEARQAPPTPKGPAPGQWKDGFARLVATVPPGADWVVVAPGSPLAVRDARSPQATLFPDNRKGRPLVDDLAHIAHLEALRYAGNRYLVLPEGSRPWFQQQAELRDHVVSSYLTVENRTRAGAVFDLTRPASAGERSLRAELTRLAGGATRSPAVLAWTDLDVAGELPGITTFRPPPGAELPYLDHSIDVVVVDETHDASEARRVASYGVITVRADAGGITVRDLERTNGTGDRFRGDEQGRVVLLVGGGPADPTYHSMLAARAQAADAELVVGAVDADTLRGLADRDVVILLEPNVLPLPGAIEAAVDRLGAQPDVVVTGKVLQADGRLESAGGTVFSDRSVALIAAGSEDVRAPWHDYARPVCWGAGLVAAAGSRWTATSVVPAGDVRTFLREWSAASWEQGTTVLYEPGIAAVRLRGDGGEPSLPLESSRWQRVLGLRPSRPPQLGDGEWRYLLAHDDVEAGRR